MEETHYFRKFICCWLFYHSSSHNKHEMEVTTTGEHLGLAPHRAVFLRWHLDNFVPKPQVAPMLPLHVAGVVFMVLVPLSETPWSVEEKINLSACKHPCCFFFFFPLGVLNPFVFLLLKMKTELYNCTQFPVPSVLRSTQAKSWVASPSSPWRQSSWSWPRTEPSANTRVAVPFISSERLLARCQMAPPVPPVPGSSAVTQSLPGSPGHFTLSPCSLPKWEAPPHRGCWGCSSTRSARHLSLDWRHSGRSFSPRPSRGIQATR